MENGRKGKRKEEGREVEKEERKSEQGEVQEEEKGMRKIIM